MKDTIQNLKDKFKLRSSKEYNAVVAERDALKNQMAELSIKKNDTSKVQDSISKNDVSSVVQSNVSNDISTAITGDKDLQAQITILKNEFAKRETDLLAQIQTANESAHVKAQAIAASIGITSEDKLPKLSSNASKSGIRITSF